MKRKLEASDRHGFNGASSAQHCQEHYANSCLEDFSQVFGKVQGDVDWHLWRSGSSLLRMESGVQKSEVWITVLPTGF